MLASVEVVLKFINMHMFTVMLRFCGRLLQCHTTKLLAHAPNSNFPNFISVTDLVNWHVDGRSRLGFKNRSPFPRILFQPF